MYLCAYFKSADTALNFSSAKSIGDLTLVGSFGDANSSYKMGKTYTFDATSIPNYQNLTADNFLLVITACCGGKPGNSGNDSKYATASPRLSYNSSTGTITITGTTASDGWGGVYGMSGKVYFLG